MSSLRHRTAPTLSTLAFAAVALACSKQPAGDTTQTAGPASDSPTPAAAAPVDAPSSEPRLRGDPHLVVFADRTSQAYLLLLPKSPTDAASKAALSREGLQSLVREKLGAPTDEPELNLLLELIATAPSGPDPSAGAADGSPRATRDLLGLNVEVLPLRSPDGVLVSDAQLQDPVLTRALTAEQRASLSGIDSALLLRAEYRNQYAVRGLRLLQTLVRVVGVETGALIHDPDTGETMGVAAFGERRLKTSLGNVADQVAVVPFRDKDGETDTVRLATRGMRRFGSPDLELDGLPLNPAVLQRATHLLYGLAYQMVRLGEFDSRGYAVELGELVTIDIDDIVRAYGKRGADVPQCESCPAELEMHLVERPPEAHDPSDHVVVRVVAPREASDRAGYDQRAWVATALADLFGA